MIELIVCTKNGPMTHNAIIKERSGVNRGARSKDPNWIYKLNAPHKGDRHPFNIITKETL